MLSPDCLAFNAHTSGVALPDDALSDDPLSDDELPDDALSDDPLSDDPLSDDALSDDALSGDALSGDALSDDALSGDALSDDALDDDALWLDSLLACTVDADITSSRCKITKADMLIFYYERCPFWCLVTKPLVAAAEIILKSTSSTYVRVQL